MRDSVLTGLAPDLAAAIVDLVAWAAAPLDARERAGRVLEGLRVHVGCDRSAVLITRTTPAELRIVSAHPAEGTPALLEQLRRRCDLIEVAVREPGRCLCPDEEVAASSGDLVVTAGPLPTTLHSLLVLQRDPGRPAFDDRDRTVVQMVGRACTSLVEAPELGTCRLGTRLTEREREVVSCLLQGEADTQVAARLGMSYSTVRSHLRGLFAKFNVSSRAELTALLLRSRAERPPPWQDAPLR